jgi:hypothetical protein
MEDGSLCMDNFPAVMSSEFNRAQNQLTLPTAFGTTPSSLSSLRVKRVKKKKQNPLFPQERGGRG